MSDIVSHIRVAVAIIEQQGRYLITQRRSTDVLAGLWEFPSSKVETGDTDEADRLFDDIVALRNADKIRLLRA